MRRGAERGARPSLRREELVPLEARQGAGVAGPAVRLLGGVEVAELLVDEAHLRPDGPLLALVVGLGERGAQALFEACQGLERMTSIADFGLFPSNTRAVNAA